MHIDLLILLIVEGFFYVTLSLILFTVINATFFLSKGEVSTTEKQQSPGPSRFISHWLYTCVLISCFFPHH